MWGWLWVCGASLRDKTGCGTGYGAAVGGGLVMGQGAAYRVMELLWGRAGLVVALWGRGLSIGLWGWLWFWLGAG